MHRFILGSTFLLVALLVAAPVQAAPIAGIFNTGVNASGVKITTDGTTDPHYTLTAPVGAGTAQTTLKHPFWFAEDLDAGWISNQPDSANGTSAAGTYHFDLTFDLTGFNHLTAMLVGGWGSDNASEIYLNGVTTGNSVGAAGFSSVTAFSIGTGFLAGSNTLSFRVNNSAGPMGLYVDFTSATANLIPAPPALLLLGIASLVFAMRGRQPVSAANPQ